MVADLLYMEHMARRARVRRVVRVVILAAAPLAFVAGAMVGAEQ